ncbi:MAG: hypothetical protein II220_07720, partial [Spirochaetales bacterium]|nr:hypothetical protein [Spirochaetales bacterium]
MDSRHSNNANSWVLIAIILLLLVITIFAGTFFKSENKLQVLLKNNQTVSCFFAVYNEENKLTKAFVLFYNSLTDRIAGVHLLSNTYATFIKGGKQDFYILSETYASGVSKEEIKNGISKLLGTQINYYLFLSEKNLVKYVDLVGGIEIFTEEISIPAKHIYYPSGIIN